MMDNIQNTPIPNLIEDNSQPHIKLTSEFSLVNHEMNNPSNIPVGSIVFASGNGITRVFNKNGKQLLIADDQVAELETPNGLFSATHVFQVPDGSIITSKGNATFVIYNNTRILTYISDKDTNLKKSLNSLVPTDQISDQYIEFANTSTLDSVAEFGATWNVPPNPNNYSYYTPWTPNVVWNGLSGEGGFEVLQPVLQWLWSDNITSEPTPPPVWTVAAWYYNSNQDVQINTPKTIGPVTGDHVRGVMELASSNMWVVYIYSPDNTTINTPFIFVDTDTFSYSNVQPLMVLEAWNAHLSYNKNYNYLCGDVIFQDTGLLDINSNNIGQNGLWKPFVNPVWNTSQFQPLNVYIVGQWPTNLRTILNTHTQNALIPLPGYSGLPTDPDGDGIYEDMNGNGIKDFNDLVLFFNQMEWIEANEPIGPFDFNGNGYIDFNDVQLLFQEI